MWSDEPSYPLLSYYVFKNRVKDFKYSDFQISTCTNLLILYYLQAANNACGNQYSYKGPPRQKKKCRPGELLLLLSLCF